MGCLRASLVLGCAATAACFGSSSSPSDAGANFDVAAADISVGDATEPGDAAPGPDVGVDVTTAEAAADVSVPEAAPIDAASDAVPPEAAAADATTAEAGCADLCGGAPLCAGTVLATGQGAAQGLAVAGGSVYWLHYAPSDAGVQQEYVSGVATGGGAVQTVVSGLESLSPWAVDATNVYYAPYGPGSIVEQPLAGGSPTTLATGQNLPIAMTVDATYVYWVNFASYGNGGTVNAVPIAGGAVHTLAYGQGDLGTLTLDGDTLVFSVCLGSSAVRAISTSGTGLVTLATCSFGSALVASGGTVYGLASGAIDTIGEDGGAPATVVPSGVSGAFAVSGGDLYWPSNDTVTDCDGGSVTVGSIVRSTTSGGSVTTLVSGLPQVYGVTTDATSVYWSAADGTIAKAPR
jgi:hypothetical protein